MDGLLFLICFFRVKKRFFLKDALKIAAWIVRPLSLNVLHDSSSPITVGLDTMTAENREKNRTCWRR